MENFVLNIPVKIIFGPGEIRKVGAEAAGIGKKALVVTGKGHVRKSGLLDKINGFLNTAGVEYTVFEGVEPNPRSTTIDKAGKIARDNNCDLILGVGGGSTMDASKGIAVAAREGNPIWDYVYNEDPRKIRRAQGALPIILIPTVAATASEGNRGAVISNWETNQKAGLFSDYIYPKVSIVDPELTVSVGRQTTIDGAMDIISHVLETYLTGPENTPLQDRFSEGVIRTVMENLEILLENPTDITARTNLSWCSTMALLGPVNLGRPGGFPLHAMEHVVSGHYDIAHGRGLAILLLPLMRYTYNERPEKYAQLARNIFFENIDNTSAEKAGMIFINKFEDWMKKNDMYCKFSQVDIGDDKIDIMASDTIKVYGGGKDYMSGYRPLYENDVREILKMAL